MLKKSTKPKFNQFVNLNEFQSNVEVTEKESTKESSQSIGLTKKNTVKKTIQELITQIEHYNPVSKFIDMSQLRQNTNVKMKRYRQCVYFGEFIESKKQGLGIMIYTNGRIYEGQWKNNYKQGQGYERFVNLAVYSGDYKKGKPNGYGRYEWQNGENYEGQWVNGVKEGSGIWRGSQGDSYIGQWKDDKAQGYGVHTWINGNRYQGQFKQCLKCGEGIQKFANGDTYKGHYQNGKPHGDGEYFWADGSSYKGQFRQGLRCGRGIWRKSNHPSADTYQGEFRNEKKQGYGVFIWSNGCKYIGNFVDDVRNGYGEMYWSDGTVYKGEWKKGEQVEGIVIEEQQQQYQQQRLQHQNPLHADFINIAQQFKRASTPNQTKRSKSKLNPTQILISNPQSALEFFPNSQQTEPEIIELKRFRARQLASRSKSRILERSMINVDKGFIQDGNNNSLHECILSGKHVEKNARKMQKKSSRLSFNTTRSPYLIQNSQKVIIKHSQSSTQGRPMSVCLYSHSKSSNKSTRNIPIKNFQGVELTRDHLDRPLMIESRSNSKTKPRMIRSSNGVRNMSHHPQNFECFWEQKPTKNMKSNKIATTNEQIKWFTRSKNQLNCY